MAAKEKKRTRKTKKKNRKSNILSTLIRRWREGYTFGETRAGGAREGPQRGANNASLLAELRFDNYSSPCAEPVIDGVGFPTPRVLLCVCAYTCVRSICVCACEWVFGVEFMRARRGNVVEMQCALQRSSPPHLL